MRYKIGMEKRHLIRILIILVLGLGIASAIATYQIHQEQNSNAITLIKKEDISAAPAIVAKNFGGPFTLTNHLGQRVTEQDYQGQWRLIYFGFTYCPAICPTELQKIATALNDLGDKGEQILPIFVSVDPERDTVDVMREYVSLFHSRLIGLTGSIEEIEQIKKEYKIYAAKVQDDTMSDYTVDHSSFIYFIDPDNNLRRIFKIDDRAQDITNFVNSTI